MNEKQKPYVARHRTSGVKFTADQLGFLSRRTRPFLQGGGTSMSIEHLLQEAYLQGLQDAADVLGGGKVLS